MSYKLKANDQFPIKRKETPFKLSCEVYRANWLDRYWKFLFLVPLLMLSGCQSLQLPPKDVSLADIQHWELKARVSIQSAEENVAATLDWQKQGATFDFHIYGTFGVTYAHLIQESNQAILKLPDDQIFYHQDAQQLLYQSLGWDFPIEALTHWIKGLPSYRPGEIIQRNELGQINEVFLNDWQVEFSRYQEYLGYTMPKIIKASHPQMTLKVVVKEWTFLFDDIKPVESRDSTPFVAYAR